MTQPIKLLVNKPLTIQIGRSLINLCTTSKKAPPCGCAKSSDPVDGDYFSQLSKKEYRMQFYIPMHIHLVDMEEYAKLQKKYSQGTKKIEDLQVIHVNGPETTKSIANEKNSVMNK